MRKPSGIVAMQASAFAYSLEQFNDLSTAQMLDYYKRQLESQNRRLRELRQKNPSALAEYSGLTPAQRSPKGGRGSSFTATHGINEKEFRALSDTQKRAKLIRLYKSLKKTTQGGISRTTTDRLERERKQFQTKFGKPLGITITPERASDIREIIEKTRSNSRYFYYALRLVVESGLKGGGYNPNGESAEYVAERLRAVSDRRERDALKKGKEYTFDDPYDDITAMRQTFKYIQRRANAKFEKEGRLDMIDKSDPMDEDVWEKVKTALTFTDNETDWLEL